MSVVGLKKNDSGNFLCPTCNGVLDYSAGGAVRVVDGRVDYENTKPRYICYPCNKYYRELLNSGFYDVFDLPPEEAKKLAPAKPVVEKKQIKKTGDLAPMQLKRDAQGKCSCPRCGDDMEYIEGGAVKIINGRADMSDTVNHFVCHGCDSVYRRIAATDYYQWSES